MLPWLTWKSLCRPGWPQAQRPCLPLPPECGTKLVHHYTYPSLPFIIITIIVIIRGRWKHLPCCVSKAEDNFQESAPFPAPPAVGSVAQTQSVRLVQQPRSSFYFWWCQGWNPGPWAHRASTPPLSHPPVLMLILTLCPACPEFDAHLPPGGVQPLHWPPSVTGLF